MKKKLIQEKQEVRKGYTFETKSIDKEQATVEGVFSTEDVDRHGEQVIQSGWKLDAYRANPVVLWAHRSGDPVIAQMLEIAVDNTNRLVGKMKFAVNENPFAKMIFDLIAGGYQRAFSAGFMNEMWSVNEAEDVYILSENELFEVSCVPIPANKLALVKAKGFDVKMYEEEARKMQPLVPQQSFEIRSEEITVEKAMEVLKQSNEKSIRSAIKELGVLLGEPESDHKGGTQVEHPARAKAQAGGKIPIAALNKAIRDLMRAKYQIINKK